MKSTIFWDVTLCSLVVYRRFGGKRCLNLSGSKSKHASNQKIKLYLSYSPTVILETVRR
jgi:hypothetical protein